MIIRWNRLGGSAKLFSIQFLLRHELVYWITRWILLMHIVCILEEWDHIVNGARFCFCFFFTKCDNLCFAHILLTHSIGNIFVQSFVYIFSPFVVGTWRWNCYYVQSYVNIVPMATIANSSELRAPKFHDEIFFKTHHWITNPITIILNMSKCKRMRRFVRNVEWPNSDKLKTLKSELIIKVILSNRDSGKNGMAFRLSFNSRNWIVATDLQLLNGRIIKGRGAVRFIQWLMGQYTVK